MQPIASNTLLQQRYRILKLLGEGEFGRTYLATDRTHKDEYRAIEEFIPTTQFPATVAAAKTAFKQEAVLLYQLQHPQISRFWATFEESNRLFLVKDYIEGKTYGHLLDDRRDLGTVFDEGEVWQLLLKILPAIEYIHRQGIIHRNISPESLILQDRDLLPLLTDFGAVTDFAQQLHTNTIDLPNIIGGKPGYSPIEQLQHGQVYRNTDLYALAVTAIVLLTGKDPSALFTGDRVNWDWREWTQIGDDFAAILHRMLSLNPQHRYQSAIEVERALQSLDISPHRSTATRKMPTGRFSPLPTTPNSIDGNSPSVPKNAVQTALTNLNVKSVWEKPQVFIPLGLLISILAGLGSWFGVSHLLHRQSSDPVVSTPPKQIDFNNPTIPTESNQSTNGETITPEMDRAVIKEGTIDANTPIRYQIVASSGQNLDIQLVPIGTNLPNQPSPNSSVSLDPITPTPTPKQTPSPKSPSSLPVPKVTTLAATQVLMSILSPTGNPIDDRADRVVGWRGEITTAGDYTIELRPIKGLAGKAFPYKLSVTQIAAIPSPSPSASVNPADGSTPPLGIPIPIGGNGINPVPASPEKTLPSTSIPTVTPTPAPISVPTTRTRQSNPNSEQSTPTRRRARTEVDPSPPVRERRRSRSTTEENSTPRRNRNRIDSNEEENPTPRNRRRNRATTTETQPQRVRSKPPATNNTERNNPPEVPGEPISVPSPRNNSVPSPTKPDSDSTAPSPDRNVTDSE